MFASSPFFCTIRQLIWYKNIEHAHGKKNKPQPKQFNVRKGRKEERKMEERERKRETDIL